MLDALISFDNSILFFLNSLPREIHVASYILGLSIYPMMLLVVYLAYKQNKMMGMKAFLSLIFAYTFSLMLKYYFHIARPYESFENLTIIEEKSSPAFPSSHATVAFAASETSTRYTNFLRIWAVMIALSRVVLGLHHITDVIAGAFLGILVGHLVNRWDLSRLVTKFKKN